MPLAAHAVFTGGDTLHLRAAWGDPEGSPTLVRVEASEAITTLQAAGQLGERVAAELRAGGAR